MNTTYINAKFAQALMQGDAPKINKVIETIIREDCIVDRIFSPVPVDISSMPFDPQNPMRKYVMVRYKANLGPAYTFGIGEPVIEHTTNNGFAPAYFYKIEYYFTKKEEEIKLFENTILDEVIEAIRERIGDQKDKIFFFDGIAQIVRKRSIEGGVDASKVQFLNAEYFSTVMGSNVIIEKSTVPQSFTDATGTYHVGIKELIYTVKNKISELRIAPGLFLLPWNFWNGLSTWDFGGAGVFTFEVFIKGVEGVLGGQMMVGINVQTTSKYVNIKEGITGEVAGPINVNVLGEIKLKDIDSTSDSENVVENASMGYLLPSDEFFGINYTSGPETIIKSDIIEATPLVRMYVLYYNALAIGNSRSYIAFPARG